jgi:NTE family protein
MQGGGSLGAYECGVFKVLAKHKMKFDIISGVSIGAVNVAIIAAGLRRERGPQSMEQQEIQEDVAKTLENFWLEIADTISPTTLPYKIRSSVAAAHSMMHSNSKAFIPIMVMPGIPAYYFPFDYPYYYYYST